MSEESHLDELCRQALRGVDDPGDRRPLEARVESAMHHIVVGGVARLIEAAAPLANLGSVTPEDAVQEALTTFARRVQETDFRHRMVAGRPFGYLWKASKNRALDMLESTLVRDRAVEKARLAPFETSEGQDERLIRQARTLVVASLLEQLSPEERDLVVRLCVYEETSRDIGEALGINAAAVRKRVSRAIARLRKHVKGMDV